MIDAALRELVVERAKRRCEYCQIPQSAVTFRAFHVEHIRARQHGGNDNASNLCLACHRCNAYKGPNLTSVDPDTQAVVPLFNPRQQDWAEHFGFRNAEIVGLTEVGRATVSLLRVNDEQRVALREELLALGQLPEY